MTRLLQTLVIVVAAAVSVVLMFSADALAATGDLTQPAGTLGCVELDATGAGEGCLEGSPGLGLDGADVLATYGTSVYVGSGNTIEVLQRDSSDAGLEDVECLQPTTSEGCKEAAPALTGASVRKLTVSPDGKTVYATATAGGNEIIAFSRNTTTGELTELSGKAGCVSADGSNAADTDDCTESPAPDGYDIGLHITVSPDGKHVYTNYGEYIWVYERDTTAGSGFGSLKPLPGECVGAESWGCKTSPPVTTGLAFSGEMTITPDGKFMYDVAAEGSVEWLKVNAETGALSTDIKASEDCIQDESLAGPDCTRPAAHGLEEPSQSILLSADANANFVYAVSGGEDQPGDIVVFERNPTSGALTQVSGVNGCASSTGNDDEEAPQVAKACDTLPSIADAESIVASPDGLNLYVSTDAPQGESLVEVHVNPETGALSEDGPQAGIDDDCYASSVAGAAAAGCTPDYRSLDGLGEALLGTLAVSSDGSEIYMTGSFSNGVAIFQRSLPPTYTVTGAVNSKSEGSIEATSTSAGATCTGKGSCTVYSGSGAVTLTVKPDSGYRLSSWSGGACPGVTNPCIVVPSANETETANFEAEPKYTVSASVGEGAGEIAMSSAGPGCDLIPDSCTVTVSTEIELKATPAEGFVFAGWSGGPCEKLNPCKVEVQASESYEADFVPGPPPTPPQGKLLIYVSEHGGAGRSEFGAEPAHPVTLARAMEVVQGGDEQTRTAPGGEILMAEGNYEGVTLSQEDSGLAIYGGLTQGFQPGGGTTTISGSPQALLLEEATGVRLQQLALSATPDSSGSVYGIRMINGSSATLADVHVSTANASPGANGAAGVRGAAGAAGTEGERGTTQVEAFELAGHTLPGEGGGAGLSPNGTFNETEYSVPPCFGGTCPYGAPNSNLAEPGDGGVGGDGNEFDHSEGYSANGTYVYGCFERAGDSGEECGDAVKEYCNEPSRTNAEPKDPPCGPNVEYNPFPEQPVIVATDGGSKGATGFGCSLPGCTYKFAKGGSGGLPGKYVEETIGGKTETGGPGGTGSTGEPGAPGALGTSSPAPTISGWASGVETGTGGGGSEGAPGGGGGGGGGGSGANYGSTLANASGDGGGGGGSAGTGGTPGAGGSSGGGAFGLFVQENSSVTIELGSSISAGHGGNGGNGGNGGAGGPGGPGVHGNTKNAGSVGAGGNGGAGGGGGPGGGGGGGQGGPSDAIWAPGGAVTKSTDSTETSAGGGIGGADGGEGENAPVTVRAESGSSSTCVGTCATNSNLPVLTPAVDDVDGGSAVTSVTCTSNCSGTLILQVSSVEQKHKSKPASAAVAGAGKVIGRVHFKAKAKHRLVLRIHLSTAGLRLLKKDKNVLPVTQKLSVRLGRSKKPKAYVSTILLVRKESARTSK
jgi:hypothetical protein